jgi:hypothetical protein
MLTMTSNDFLVVGTYNNCVYRNRISVTIEKQGRPHVVVEMAKNFFWAVPITKQYHPSLSMTIGASASAVLKTKAGLTFDPSFLQPHSVQCYQNFPLGTRDLCRSEDKVAFLQYLNRELVSTCESGKIYQCSLVSLNAGCSRIGFGVSAAAFQSMTVLVLSSDSSLIPSLTVTPVFGSSTRAGAIEILVYNGGNMEADKLYVSSQFTDLDHHWIDLNYVFSYGKGAMDFTNQPVFTPFAGDPTLIPRSIQQLSLFISQMIASRISLCGSGESSDFCDNDGPPDQSIDGKEVNWESDVTYDIIDLHPSPIVLDILNVEGLSLTEAEGGEWNGEEDWGDDGLYPPPVFLDLRTELGRQHKEEFMFLLGHCTGKKLPDYRILILICHL